MKNKGRNSALTTLVIFIIFVCGLPARSDEVVLLKDTNAAWTDQRKVIFANKSRSRVTISIPHTAMLTNELFQITVRVANPLPVPLELPIPFHVYTGQLVFEEKDSRRAKEFGVEYFSIHPDVPTVYPLSPTIILAPGDSVQRSFWSLSSNNGFHISAPAGRGKYRLTYSHWPAEPAYFEIVDEALVASYCVTRLPGLHPLNHKEMAVVVFAAQLKDDWWLFQARPGEADRLSPAYLGAIKTPITSNRFSAFTRVARLPGPLTRLEASLIGDSTLHIAYQAADGMSRTIETKIETGEVIREW